MYLHDESNPAIRKDELHFQGTVYSYFNSSREITIFWISVVPS
jgi:hypothetical protein